MSQFVEFCDDLGVDKVSFFFDVSLIPRNKETVKKELARTYAVKAKNSNIEIENLQLFESWALGGRLDKPVCVKPTNEIFVSERGDVGFCCHFRESLGNIEVDTLERIWNSAKAKRDRIFVANGNYRYCGSYCHKSWSRLILFWLRGIDGEGIDKRK